MFFDNGYGLTQMAKTLGRVCRQNPKFQHNILLYGDLGTGKTTFSRYFLREVMNSPALPVVSPTFTLEVKYRHNHCDITHMDLYRLQHANEAHILHLKDSYWDGDEWGVGVGGESVKTHHTIPLPNTKLPQTPYPINLIEWPHVLHGSEYMPKDYVRIDLKDQITHKKVTISFHGKHYSTPYHFQSDGGVNGKEGGVMGDRGKIVAGRIEGGGDDGGVGDDDNVVVGKVGDDHPGVDMQRFDHYIISQLNKDLVGLMQSEEYVQKLTRAVYFGEDMAPIRVKQSGAKASLTPTGTELDNMASSPNPTLEANSKGRGQLFAGVGNSMGDDGGVKMGGEGDDHDVDHFGDDNDDDDDLSTATFIPRQFTNHRL